MEDNINKIKEKLNHKVIHISRVPLNTYKRFRELANKEDFEEDYGNALKYLLDFYYGIIPTGVEHIEQEVMVLRQEVESLKQIVSKEQKPVRKRLDGRGIKNEWNIK